VSDAQQARPGLKCEKCGLLFALTLASQDMSSAEELPDPFEAKCHLCQHEAPYPKSSILPLVGVSAQ